MSNAYKVTTFLSTLLLFAPFFAGAITVEELRVQIEDLLRRIEVLQQKITAGAGTPQSTPTSSGKITCPRVGITLRQGSTGEDVTRLQQFLALDTIVYPEGLATGYYGALTEAAVGRWQAKYNIVSSGTSETTGYGQYGPRTAALMAIKCQEIQSSGVATQVGGFIKVFPISGAAPLMVTVEATLNTTRSCGAATYTVDYGDSSQVTNIPAPAGVCVEQKQTLTHVYQYGGTYLVTLFAGGHKTQATVVVSGSQAPPNTLSACGADILAAQRDALGKVVCPQVVQSLQCPYDNAYTYSMSNGCESSYLISRGWNTQQQTPSNIVYGGMSITPDPNGNYLSVEASFDVTSCAQYEFSWGDSSVNTVGGGVDCPSGSATVVTKTFTHTYPSPGTYTATLERGSQTDIVDLVIVAD